MIQKPSKGRAIIKQDFNTLQITIPSKRNWFILIFLSFWMIGWLAGESAVIFSLLSSKTLIAANAFMIFWLVGWTVGGAFVIITILWQLFGNEFIQIEKGVLSIKKNIFGIGRQKQYDIRSIKSMTHNPVQDNVFGTSVFRYNKRFSGLKNGKIKFDYGMDTIQFANDIDEAEAKMLIEKLRKNSNFRSENFMNINE